MRTVKVYCPVNGWDCPYFLNGECGLEDPYKDCDDFAAQWDAGETDCVSEDEERTAYLDEGR